VRKKGGKKEIFHEKAGKEKERDCQTIRGVRFRGRKKERFLPNCKRKRKKKKDSSFYPPRTTPMVEGGERTKTLTPRLGKEKWERGKEAISISLYFVGEKKRNTRQERTKKEEGIALALGVLLKKGRKEGDVGSLTSEKKQRKKKGGKAQLFLFLVGFICLGREKVPYLLMIYPDRGGKKKKEE